MARCVREPLASSKRQKKQSNTEASDALVAPL